MLFYWGYEEMLMGPKAAQVERPALAGIRKIFRF